MNEKEKMSYLKALVHIALADDTIEEGEEKYLNQIGDLYGLQESQISELKYSLLNKQESLEDILSEIQKRETKLMLLYDLLALCYTDNNYSIIEKQGMRNVCDILKIESGKLTEMEQVMQEQVELQEKINKILER